MSDQRTLDDYYNELNPRYPLAPPSDARFEREGDSANEREVAAVLERVWACRVREWAPLNPVDYWIEKHRRMAGVVEIKRRYCAHDCYPTAYLAARKYRALTAAAEAFGVPAFYAIRYDDGIYWAALVDVDGRSLEVVHSRPNRGLARDIEPVVLVSIDVLHGPES